MLSQFLRRARLRLLWADWFAAAGVIGCVFLAGCIALLIFGTSAVSWWWPIILGALAALGMGIWVWRRTPSVPQVALLLDRRCGLADTLGTALHFDDSSLPFAGAQRLRAAQTVQQIELANALPYQVPRAIFVAAGLAAVVSGLFFFRLETEEKLVLEAPIARISLSPFADAKRPNQTEAARKKEVRIPDPDFLSRLGASTADTAAEEHLPPVPSASAANNPAASPKEGVSSNPFAGEQKGEGKADGSGTKSDESNEGAAKAKEGAEQTGSSQTGAPQGPQAGGKSKSASEGQGLLSKLRDAVSSLMSKAQTQPQKALQPQQAQASPPGKQNGQKQGQQSQTGSESEPAASEPTSSDEEQSAQGKGAGNTKEQNASAKPGSGMGHQDGSKDLQDAAQLAAMGKLSEIIGKRSANISGEMTIESQSGPQQLKTGYSQAAAKHAGGNGDVDRDEVPVEMQSYVQQYFNRVREQTSIKTKANTAQP